MRRLAPDQPSSHQASGARRRWRRSVPWVLGLLSVGLVVWIAWRADLDRLWATLRAADARWLGLVGIAIVASMSLRAARWCVLLLPARVSWLDSATAVAIGYLGNNLLPSRSGELLRAYALRRQADVPFGTGFGTVVTERVFDALLLVTLLAGLLLVLPLALDLGVALLLGASFYVAIFVGLLVLRRFRARLIGFLEGAAGRLPSGFGARARRFLGPFLASLFAFRGGGQFVTYTLISLLVWGTEAFGFGCLMRSLDIDLGGAQIALVVILTAFGTAIPALPGALGTYELVVVATLEVLAVETATATAFAFTAHLLSWFMLNLLGALAVLRLGTGLRSLAADAAATATDTAAP